MRLALAVIVAALISVIALGGCVAKSYHISRDITSVKSRAQVAADREDMSVYLAQLQSNMKKYGLTHGYAALLFKNPNNDMGLTYESITRLQERLHSLDSVKRNSTTYQVALDDMRGTIREIHLSTDEISWAKFGWWLTLIALVPWLFVVIIWYRDGY